MNKIMVFDATISNVQKINPLFSKCDIRVMYEGANRNNSFISRQTVDDAQYSIYNIPIVGEWKESIADFGSHGGKVEISDEGIKFIQTTKPYGVVPSGAKVYWQPIAAEDGTVREYLIVEGAYLWTGRYPEAADLISNTKGQSMEIEVLNGHTDNNGLVVISEMVFSALCILGDEVEPCFEDANIKAYNFSKDDFKQEFTTMIKELKASLHEDVENYGKEVENVLENQEQEFAANGLTPEEIKKEREQEGYVDTEDMAKADGDAEDKKDGGADESEEDANGQKKMAKDDPEDAVDGGADEGEEDANGKKKMSLEEVEAYAASLEAELEIFKAEYSVVATERDVLRAFKLEVEKQSHEASAEEIFAQFDKLDEEEIQQVRAEMFDLSLEQIEEKLYFMLGKKVAKFSNNAKKTETVKVVFSQSSKEDKAKSDGYDLSHLFEQYSDK